jgi:hypothetical protein
MGANSSASQSSRLRTVANCRDAPPAPAPTARKCGGAQGALAGQSLPAPLVVQASRGALPWPGVVVTFSAAAGSFGSSSVTTDAEGLASTGYTMAGSAHFGDNIALIATAGEAETVLHATVLMVDTDGDGLADEWEMQMFGHLASDPADDPDNDGLSNLEEQQAGTQPASADSDGDGITDTSELQQGTDAKNAGSRPAFESVKVVGKGGPGERKSKELTLTLPEGEQTYLVVVAAQSEEYPGYTGTQSEFDDVVDWRITPAGGAVIEGERHVNELHEQWEESVAKGGSFLGLSPAAVVVTKAIQGRAGQTTSVQIELGAKNVSDGVLPTTLVATLLPVEVVAVFGFEWQQTGKDRMDNALAAMVDEPTEFKQIGAETSTFYIKGKPQGANAGEKYWAIQTARSEAAIKSGLTSAPYVVFEGHANMGLGPTFNNQPAKISDFTNFGNPQAAINWEYMRTTDYPNFTTITAAETPSPVANYMVLPQKINMERYPNSNGVGIGQNFTLKGTGLGRHHYNRVGDNEVLIVNAGKADLPALGYQAFFYNSCNTARDFGEVFQHGKFFCSNVSCYPDYGASVKFVEGLVTGKTWADILATLNQTHANDPEFTGPAYRLVE